MIVVTPLESNDLILFIVFIAANLFSSEIKKSPLKKGDFSIVIKVIYCYCLIIFTVFEIPPTLTFRK